VFILLGVTPSLVDASYESERAVINFFVGWNNGQNCSILLKTGLYCEVAHSPEGAGSGPRCLPRR
jgi:hypothetical protein